MTIDDERLKRLFQGYAEAKTPPSRDGCPSPSEMARSFEPSASAREKMAIVDHMATCPPCREEFMVLLEWHRRDADRLASTVRQSRSFQPALWRLAGAALGLCLIVASVVVLRHQGDLSTRLRSTPAGITLLAPKAGRSVSGVIGFRWSSRVASDYFIFELFDDAMLPVWTSDRVPEPRLEIPADVKSRLAAGRTYFWLVTGYANEAKTGESPLGRFKIGR